jgi:hypothetical protein
VTHSTTARYHPRRPGPPIPADTAANPLRDFVSALASDAGIQHTLPAITAAATALIPGVDVADVLLAPAHHHPAGPTMARHPAAEHRPQR